MASEHGLKPVIEKCDPCTNSFTADPRPPRYALMPLEGFPASRLPTWPDCAGEGAGGAGAGGASSCRYLIDLPAGKRRIRRQTKRRDVSITCCRDRSSHGERSRHEDRSSRQASVYVRRRRQECRSRPAKRSKLIVLRKTIRARAASRPAAGADHLAHRGREVKQPWAGNPHSLCRRSSPTTSPTTWR